LRKKETIAPTSKNCEDDPLTAAVWPPR
jgi:hypothetical protein